MSVSLPAVKTCREDAGCHVKCYARKLERLRPNVRAAYQHNLDVLNEDPDTYWREVEGAIMLSRFFRFHVSGDIPDEAYFLKMIEVAQRNPHCEILCFTKKFEIVTKVVEILTFLPKNLHIIFSIWPNLNAKNLFHFPEAHVRFRDGTTTARADAKECGGNCTVCANTNGGCWSLKYGEQVVFNEH